MEKFPREFSESTKNEFRLRRRIRKGEFLDKIIIDKGCYEICGGGFEHRIEFIDLDCYNRDDKEHSLVVKIPIPITFDEEWFEKFKKLNLDEISVLGFIKAGAIKK